MENAVVKNRLPVVEIEKEVTWLPRLAKPVLKQLGAAAAGFILAQLSIFGELSPFSVAFAAAVPGGLSLAAAFGSAAGIFSLAADAAAVRSLGAVAAAAAIGNLLSRFVTSRESRVTAPVTAFFSCVITGLTAQAAQGFSVNSLVLFLCEGVLSGGTAYFFKRTAGIVPLVRGGSGFGIRSAVCAGICVCVFLASFAQINIYGVVPARIIGSFAVLVAAKIGKEIYGAVVGVCAGAPLGLATGMASLGGGFGLAGLLAGLFAPFGSWVMSGIYFLSVGVLCILSGGEKYAAVLLETGIASVAFGLVPTAAYDGVKKFFVKSRPESRAFELGDELVVRLASAEGAVRGISECIDKVGEGLKKLSEPSSALVTARVRESVCERCPSRRSCWGTHYSETLKAFDSALVALARDGFISADELDPVLRQRCLKAGELMAQFNKAYMSCVALKGGAARAAQLRNAAAGQFDCLADILGDIAHGVKSTGGYDSDAASRAADALASFDLSVSAVSCAVDADGRMSVGARTRETREELNKSALARAVSSACGIEMGLPMLCRDADGMLITLAQKTAYKVRLGAVQLPSGDDVCCGDYFECFSDGRGHELIVLSDGMGTGGRAAVDAALTAELYSRLVKAGIGFECAAKVVNSALLIKGADESLATLDAVSIDLYTGRADFVKAGGAATFVRKNGRAAALELSALPLGILRETELGSSSATLGSGDIILTLSDGAVRGDGVKIISELEKWNGDDPQELAEKIAENALRYTGGDRRDDITVIAAVIAESENKRAIKN